jgi:phospholipid/cholesterol/gamma-HCH transport system substrate-binding protein
MTIIALAILGYLTFLISGSRGLFRSRSSIFTYMGDSSDLADGAPVRLNGIVIGKVRTVRLSGSNDPDKVIKVDMEIDKNYMPAIPVDSKAKIASGNLLGTKYINITKGQSPQTVQDGAELGSASTAALEDVFQQGDSALAALESILKKMDGIIDSVQVGKGTIGKLLVDETIYNKFVAIADDVQKLTTTLNSSEGTLGKLLHDDKLYDDVRGTVARVNSLVDGINQGEGTAGKLLKDPALYDDARKTIADIRQMLADINAGKGTVGKLLKSDDLHDQIQKTIASIDTLLDKMNSGQGTIGQLLVNPTLYESLDGTTRELHGLLQDFRSNPKKFLHIKIGLF